VLPLFRPRGNDDDLRLLPKPRRAEFLKVATDRVVVARHSAFVYVFRLLDAVVRKVVHETRHL